MLNLLISLVKMMVLLDGRGADRRTYLRNASEVVVVANSGPSTFDSHAVLHLAGSGLPDVLNWDRHVTAVFLLR